MKTYELNGERCPHCGRGPVRSREVVASDVKAGGRITIRECSACVFAWQWPLARSEDESADCATRRYSEHQDNAYYDPQVRARVADLHLDFIASLKPLGRRLLDVGAGDGKFVEHALQQGWDAWGVDPGAPPAAHGRLRRCPLAEMPAAERFDVVTLWDVIEHVEDPVALLSQAVGRLSPEGHLIVETGNYQSGERIAAGGRWWGYAADHRWYFSPPVLEELMRDMGLAAIVHANRVLRPEWKGEPRYRIWLGGHVRRVLRRPRRALAELRTLLALRNAAHAWPRWSGLGIVTVAGRRAAAGALPRAA